MADALSKRGLAVEALHGDLSQPARERVVEGLHEAVLPGVRPDRTLILDVEPEIGLERARASRMETSRYEDLDLTYHRTVRDAFRAIAEREPQRCVVIDASMPADAVEEAVWEAVTPYLSTEAG